MKTKLPEKITSVQEAEMFLEKLYINKESFHPEDDAFDIDWGTCEKPTDEELTQLNKLMGDIYECEDVLIQGFDPCEFLLRIERNEMFSIFMCYTSTQKEQLREDFKKAGTLSSMHYHDQFDEWLIPVLARISSQIEPVVFGWEEGEAFCRIGGKNATHNTSPVIIEACYYSALEYLLNQI